MVTPLKAVIGCVEVKVVDRPEVLFAEVEDRGNGFVGDEELACDDGRARDWARPCRLLGGELHAGPAPGHGWSVHARLPLRITAGVGR